MERLTSYDEIGNKIEDYKNIVLVPETPLLDKHYRGKAIDRLAEFEDFMEEQGFESFEELNKKIKDLEYENGELKEQIGVLEEALGDKGE